MSTSQDLVEGLRFRRDDYLRQEAALEARLDLTRQIVRDLSLLLDNADLADFGPDELREDTPTRSPKAKPAPPKKPAVRRTKATKKNPPMSAEVFDTLLKRARLVAKESGKFTAQLLRDRLHVSDDQARKVVRTLLQNGEIDEAGRATGGRGTPPTLYALKSVSANGSSD